MGNLNRRLQIVIWISLVAALSACATAPQDTATPTTATADTAKAVSADPNDALPRMELTPEVLYDVLLGEIAGQRGHIAAAAEVLARAAQTTRDPRLAERATLAGLYSKRYVDGMKSALLWVELRPSSTEAREALATIMLELDQPVQAQLQLEMVISLEQARSNLGNAYQRLAAVLGRHSNRATALEIMQALVDKHPDEPAAYFALAHLAVRSGDLDKADVATGKALELQPGWQDAALFRARVLVSQKDMLKALAFYEDFLARYPDATNVRLNYARFLIDQKQWDKARAQFLRVVSELPEDADAVYAVGLLSLQTNHIEDAEKYLRRSLELRPENDQARIYLGQATEQRKDYAQAAEWYREVQQGEQYFEAQTRLSVVIARQGDLKAARRHLHSVHADNNPQRVQLVLAEEQILREGKQYAEALKVLDTALGQIPRDKDLLYARALMAEKLDMLDRVEADLKTILKDDPKNVHALNALGYTLADRTERFQEAEELLQQAITLKPDDPFILDSIGWLQYRMGKNAEAIRHLKRAIGLRPDAEIAAHLGEVLWVMGNRNEAESVWNRALRDTPDSEALLGVIKKFKP